MSYQSIKKLFRSGNIAAAKAALVEALKNNTLTAVEKKSVIRLNSEPLLEAYAAGTEEVGDHGDCPYRQRQDH